MMAQPSYRTILRYYWTQARKHRGFMTLVFIGYFVGTIGANIVSPLWYRRIIDTISGTNDPLSVWPDLLKLLTLVAITMLVYNTGFRFGDYAITRFESRTMRDLFNFSFENLTKHSYKFFTNNFSGSLVTKIKRFVRSFEDAFDNIAFVFWMTSIQIVGVVSVLFVTVPLLAVFFLIWIAVYIWLAWYLTKKKIPYDLRESNADSRVTGRLADVITNILNLKMFSSRGSEIESFGKITEMERVVRHEAWHFGNQIWLVQSVLFAILEFFSIGFSLYLWREGAMSTGTIVLVQLYIVVMFHNLWNIGKALGKISKNLADASELVEIFETPIEIRDLKNPEEVRISRGEIKFDSVYFRYGKKTNRVFENFSFTIPAGQRVGLAGHSGAGKTTITKLILRFADVQKGQILIDGQDITHIKQDDLRSKIAYVPQDPILFHRSLLENIAYGKPEASYEEIIEAAKYAHAHEFISKFPNGYETLVGERGIKLSGGERQRVAIARAMLKDAPILILDEATSSLDSVSEHYIRDALRELMKNRTTIVIAHRLSTVQNLDRILVIEEGRIAEDGTHEELLSAGGVYAEYWTHQTSAVNI